MTFCAYYLEFSKRHDKGECAFCDSEKYRIPFGKGSLNGSWGLKPINFERPSHNNKETNPLFDLCVSLFILGVVLITAGFIMLWVGS